MGLFKGSEDVSEQLKKISDHLGFLEKKIDTLIEQSQNRRPGGFSRPSGGGHFGNNRRPQRSGGFSQNREHSGPNREFSGGNRDPRDHYRSRGQNNRPRGYGQQRPHRPAGSPNGNSFQAAPPQQQEQA